MSDEVTAWIGLGSNVGDRRANLRSAMAHLDAGDDIAVIAVSTIYETEPIGGPPQDAYLNAAVAVRTRRTPDALLALCLAVEAAHGRVRAPSARWGPRPLDLDVLLYGGIVHEAAGLRIPHPRLHERAFVLLPLAEIAPRIVHPLLQRPIAALADALVLRATRVEPARV